MQVLTNSLPIIESLLGDPTVRLHVPGGEIFREQNIILSPFENNGVNQYAASKMFVGAAALTQRGLLQTDSILVQAEQRMIARADELIVVADSSKFKAEGSLVLCQWDSIMRIITDDGITKSQRAMVEAFGVELIIADR